MINIPSALYEARIRPRGIHLLPRDTYSFRDDVSIEAPCEVKTSVNGIVSLGAYSYINGPGRFVDVLIGRYSSIAEGVLTGYPEHPTSWLSTSTIQYRSPKWANLPKDWIICSHSPTERTRIGNDVWIGAGAFIRTGIVVGDGAIIGASAVVTRDVPAYAVVAGNPARIIRYRFPPTVIEELLLLSWWQFDMREFKGISFDDVDKAIREIKVRIRDIRPMTPFTLNASVLNGLGSTQ